MFKLVNEICEILYKMRAFKVCTSTSLKNGFLLGYEGKRHLVTIEEVSSDDEEDMLKTMERLIGSE